MEKMENYKQKMDNLLRRAVAQGVARAAETKRPFITNIVVTSKEEERPKEELKSLKDIWRNMDSKNPTPATRSRKTRKSTKGKNSRTKKLSFGNKNHREEWQSYPTNMENIPVQLFAGFRRNKTSSLLEKCIEDTPPQLDKGYVLATDSPGSDQSPDTSPLKNVKKPVTNYFQRMGTKTASDISPDIIHSNAIYPETEYTLAFSKDSSFITDESGDVLMTSAASSPDRQTPDNDEMIFSDSPSGVMGFKGPMFRVSKNATSTYVRLPLSPKATLDQTSGQNGITPPNRNAFYLQKGKHQQKSTEFVTVGNLNNISPGSLQIIAAASGKSSLEGFKLDNPFIV